jgi:hypothetical protein
MLQSPVVIFIYKRSNNFEAICDVLRVVKPKSVFIVGDGPKNKLEANQIRDTRQQLESYIDWPCTVRRNYAKTNLGLKERFRTGIDWVFKYAGRAIFIEDDCIPDATFFTFCDELLEKYKDDERIFSISGNNFQFGANRIKDSYYFSRYPHIWGWATWKRSWDSYDAEIKDWASRRETNWLRVVTGGFIIAKFWKYIFDRLSAGKINTWDYQLTYASLKNRALNIIPVVNLVTNVGYGPDSTNIKSKNKTIAVATAPMQFPLVHPTKFIPDDASDRRIENLVYLHPLGKVSLVIKSILGLI